MSDVLDSILNVIIPLLIIAVVIGFVWVKLLEPLIGKYFKKRGESEPSSGSGTAKEIVYGDTI
jgi:large-conductance mechanosensitive channel